MSPEPRPYLQVKRRGAVEHIYYRRKGTYIALPGPVGSDAFIQAYDRASASFEAPAPRTGSGLHTVDDAVTHYLTTPAYTDLAAKTRPDYRRQLDEFRARFGALRLAALDEAWIEQLRLRYAARPDEGKAGQPDKWNRLRSRMIAVVTEYRIANPNVLPANHWKAARRLKNHGRQSHQPWTLDTLALVIRSATPEFRALLIAYILTAQRGIDVTRLAPEHYDAEARTLAVRQKKTDKRIKIHVPQILADAIAAMENRLPDRLFVTPRGKPWTTARAQETLATLLRQTELPRQTLHGLRATGPTFGTEKGFSNRALRTLTGHDSDQNLETYLQGANGLVMARPLQEAMAEHFGKALAPEPGEALNTRRFTGKTGRAAASANQSGNRVGTGNNQPTVGKKIAV